MDRDDVARSVAGDEIPAEWVRFVERTMALLAGPRPSEASPLPPDPGRTPAGQIRLLPLTGDGSPRRILRVLGPDQQAILMVNPPPGDRRHPGENEGFLAVRQFLHQRRVRVPRFYAADLARGYLLLEDLGDRRLYDLRAADGRMPPAALSFYEQAIGYLVQMQMPGTPPFDPATVPNPAYTQEFVWEQEARYFHTELVEGVYAQYISPREIEAECRRLAAVALHGVRCGQARPQREPVFMHRDYQSRNLMVIAGRLAVIDFQGARLGPPEYDLAALLYDPYARLDEETRQRLLRAYQARAIPAGVPGIIARAQPGGADWRRILLANAANRLMQALGAFAKLGCRLARPSFREHIPTGLETLDAVLAEWEEAPRLHSLVQSLRQMST